MEENEDEPDDVRNATPVEEELKRGEIDEISTQPTQPFDSTTRKHRCEKNIAKKRVIKSEGECCKAKLAKAAKAPKTMTVLMYEKECTLSKTKVIPRHCLSKDEWIDILATPSRKCPSPCLRKSVTRKIRPVSPRMAELAQPPKQRLLNTLQDRGGTLPIELLDNLIQTLEGKTCLTPEQAEKMFRDKDNRSKKKCRKKKNHPCKSNKSSKNAESGVASNLSSLDKEAVHCQYSMAESFVKSILDWKCPIPREEFKDIADVILKRLGYILEYNPVNGEDRKSQQMRFLADIIASWIAGVLFDVAEAKKAELEEECEKRRKEKEEETDEDSDDEDSDDDDDDDMMPGGRGGPPRKDKDDKRKKGGEDGKKDDDDEKPGKPGKKDVPEDKLELEDDGGEDRVPSAPQESPLMPENIQTQDKERESKEEVHHAITESESPPDGDEKISVKKLEDEIAEEGHKDDEPEKDTTIEKLSGVPPGKEEMAKALEDDDLVAKKSVEVSPGKEEMAKDLEDDDLVAKKSVEVSPGKEEMAKALEDDDLVAKKSVEVSPGEEEMAKALGDDDLVVKKSVEVSPGKEEMAKDLEDNNLVAKKSVEVSPGKEEMAKDLENDNLVATKSVEVSQGPEQKEAIGDEKKPEDTFVDYKSLGISEAPIATASSPEESATAKISEIGDFEKKIIADLPTDYKADGDKIGDEGIAAKATSIPEVSMMAESKIIEDTQATTIPIDSGDPGITAKKDSEITSPIRESSIPIVEEREFRKKEEIKTSVGPSGEEIKIPVEESREVDEIKMKTMEISQDSPSIQTAEREGEETKFKEDELKKVFEPLKDSSKAAIVDELGMKKIDLKLDEDQKVKSQDSPSIQVAEGEGEEMKFKEDELKKVFKPLKDSSKAAIVDELGIKKIDLKLDEDQKVIETSEEPSSLVTIEALKDKRRESEKKKSKKVSRIALVGKGHETDPPFLTFDKIFHTIYNAIEATNENPGIDSITNRLHRAVYEKCSYVVQEENPGPMSELTKDILDVMSGKIALWLRNVLTDSQLSFMNKFPATVESVEVREWSKWISYVSDTANTWSAWIQQTIKQAEDMRTNEITRGDWQDWTKTIETDAIRWRRFYLESVHQAHENLTMIRDRHVVKTGTKITGEKKDEYEKEMKITDLEVER